MEQMKRRLVLAVVLGVVMGVGLGYSPLSQPGYAPRSQLLMQQTNQPSAATFSSHPTSGLLPIIVGLLAGLVTAAPAFLIARRSAS